MKYLWFVALILSFSLDLCEQCSVVPADVWNSEISQPENNGTWDYLIFTQIWPPGYCEFTKCSYPRHGVGFNIHGLWANTFPSRGVNKCEGPKYNNDSIKDIFEELKHEWMDLHSFDKPWKFWSHEWEKHGVCVIKDSPVIKDQHDYFAKSLELKKHYNLTQIFHRLNVMPSNSTLCNRDFLLEKLKQQLGVDIWLQCSSMSGEDARLVEARICLDRNLKPFNCPPLQQRGEMQLLSLENSNTRTGPCPKSFVFA